VAWELTLCRLHQVRWEMFRLYAIG
jgi:hypothetical protein